MPRGRDRSTLPRKVLPSKLKMTCVPAVAKRWINSAKRFSNCSTQTIQVQVTNDPGGDFPIIFPHSVNFELFYYRAGARLSSPPASINVPSSLFTLHGYVTLTISFTSSAQDGDVAYVVAHMQDP